MSAVSTPAASRRPRRDPAEAADPLPGTRRQRRRLTGLWFVAPFAAVFLLVIIAPIGYAIYLSLFRDRLVGGTIFVGLDNYLKALDDPAFWDSVLRVAGYMAVQVPVMLALSLLAALALDSARLYFTPLYRIALFLPYAIPAVVAALMWGFMYGTDSGLIGNLNSSLGLDLPDPLSGNYVLAAIGNVATWEFVGFNMLILYSALQLVPRERYEAATIDGAGWVRVIRHIKLPAMRPSLVLATVFSVIGSFQLFNEPSVLKTLSPNTISTSYTPNLYAYNLSFAGQQFNYAAAISILIGVITMTVAFVIQFLGTRREATR
ncbi:sugar ABC transporter permease [Streptomyces sp. DSM 44915]|uniref:Sugar ABC transporter permease n=1 Tax=Streptomyces chisholmiae TaxID=3075540 RepID=A0ABU2JRB6_9ACTN|nr:sugar ABC transporter permease [Streptomyces sp. DSM 44915]MDT0267521.1 sugar ABC transporter permease [Streptomyces sp. DSM 44915]